MAYVDLKYTLPRPFPNRFLPPAMPRRLLTPHAFSFSMVSRMSMQVLYLMAKEHAWWSDKGFRPTLALAPSTSAFHQDLRESNVLSCHKCTGHGSVL